jgi:DNA-binding NarL/FixJ family response regulator
VRLILADDSVLFRQSLACALREAGHTIVGEAGTPEDLLAMVATDQPDVAVVDVRMPPTFTSEGIRAALSLRASSPGVGVLVLSQYVETVYAFQLLEQSGSGVGYLLKGRVSTLATLIEAIETVGRGGSVIDSEVVRLLVRRQRVADPLDHLTHREREVLSLMAEGRSNQAIRERMVVGAKTVETHVANIFGKLTLSPAPDDHRRVLAVLAYLRSLSGDADRLHHQDSS